MSDVEVMECNLARDEFNQRRKLFLPHIPPVTHEDVKEYLQHVAVADIVISKRLKHAIVTLKNTASLELVITELQGRTLRGCTIHPEVYPRRMMLCITGLPSFYTKSQFRQFLSKYGEAETALLSVICSGVSRGYGFVEFSHNRATLEQVQAQINGSVLENNIIYCQLVLDTMRAYEHTHSSTLYTVLDNSQQTTDASLTTLLSGAKHYRLDDDRQLFIMEFSNSAKADEFWIFCTQQYSCLDIRFSMPGLTSEQIYNSLASTHQTKYPCLENMKETHSLLLEMFPHDVKLISSIENLLEQLRPRMTDQKLTAEIVLNIVSLLKKPLSCKTMQTVPAIAAQSSMSSVGCAQQYSTPVTRSRSQAAEQLLTMSEYTNNFSSHKSENTINPVQPLASGQYEERQSSSGPVTRLRRRTTENSIPYRKTPGAKGPKLQEKNETVVPEEIRCTNYSSQRYRRPRDTQENRNMLFELDLNSAWKDLMKCRKSLKSTPPVVKKLLPEPEPSPDSETYIGQHSQGIGGHYADSYQTLQDSNIQKKLW